MNCKSWLIGLCSMALVACGGGGGAGSTTSIEKPKVDNRKNVPQTFESGGKSSDQGRPNFGNPFSLKKSETFFNYKDFSAGVIKADGMNSSSIGFFQLKKGSVSGEVKKHSSNDFSAAAIGLTMNGMMPYIECISNFKDSTSAFFGAMVRKDTQFFGGSFYWAANVKTDQCGLLEVGVKTFGFSSHVTFGCGSKEKTESKLSFCFDL